MTRMKAPTGAPTAVAQTKPKAISAVDEIAVRIEAATANSSYALVGLVDPETALKGTVRMLERAALYLRVLNERVA